jgi:hypothetical protein
MYDTCRCALPDNLGEVRTLRVAWVIIASLVSPRLNGGSDTVVSGSGSQVLWI